MNRKLEDLNHYHDLFDDLIKALHSSQQAQVSRLVDVIKSNVPLEDLVSEINTALAQLPEVDQRNSPPTEEFRGICNDAEALLPTTRRQHSTATTSQRPAPTGGDTYHHSCLRIAHLVNH